MWVVGCGLWFMVYGLWFMVYGLWFMVYGLWFHSVQCGRVAGRNAAGRSQKFETVPYFWTMQVWGLGFGFWGLGFGVYTTTTTNDAAAASGATRSTTWDAPPRTITCTWRAAWVTRSSWRITAGVITRHTEQTEHVTRHTSHVTRHTSHVTRLQGRSSACGRSHGHPQRRNLHC